MRTFTLQVYPPNLCFDQVVFNLVRFFLFLEVLKLSIGEESEQSLPIRNAFVDGFARCC